MDAFLTSLVAAALAEWGDKTQLVVAALAARSGKPGAVLLGLFAAALASSLVVAFAGIYVAETINIRALSLLVALALLFGGVGGLIPRRKPAIGSERWPVALAALILCLAAEVGDRTQFLTFALAGRFDSAPLAGAGATFGILAAAVPAALLGDRLKTAAPNRTIRYSVAALFLVVGFIIAMKAMQLA